MSDAPVLDAYRSGVNTVVWCDHERRWHYHGACSTGRCQRTCTCPLGSGDGHRVAHCACPESPYKDGGYVLREIAPLTDEVRRRHGQQGAWRCRCGTGGSR